MVEQLNIDKLIAELLDQAQDDLKLAEDAHDNQAYNLWAVLYTVGTVQLRIAKALRKAME